MLISVLLICGCTKKSNSKETDLNNKEIDKADSKVNEVVNSDSVSGYQTIYGGAEVDMNVYNTPLDKLVEVADIIYKGKLINMELDTEDDTNYTFEVVETLKGNVDKKIVINSIGGIVPLSEYKSWAVTPEKSIMEIEDDENKYVFWTAFEKLMVVSPDSEFIIFATKNSDKDSYYFTHLYYGIYENKGDNVYVRNSDEEDEYREVTEDEIKNMIAMIQ